MSRLLGVFCRNLLLLAFVSLTAAAAWTGEGLSSPVSAVAPATGGAFNLIYAFSTASSSIRPCCGPVLDASGNLYSMTETGGKIGCGNVFSLSRPMPPNGARTFQVLYIFKGGATDGCLTNTPLVLRNNVLYGASSFGFTRPGNPSGPGDVFSLTASGGKWTYKVIHAFDSTASDPNTLVVTPDGTLYGTAIYGGRYNLGELFSVSATGVFSVVHDFDFAGGINGLYSSALSDAGHGVVLGTAVYSTLYTVCWQVFSYSHTDGYLVRYQAECRPGSADIASGRIAIGPKDEIFGTANDFDAGTGYAYSLTPTASGPWVFAKIYSCTSCYLDGVIRAETGELYGTFYQAQMKGNGTLYRLSPPVTGTTWTFSSLYGFPGCDQARPDNLTIFQGVIFGDTSGEGVCRDLGGVFAYKTYLSPPPAATRAGLSPNSVVPRL